MGPLKPLAAALAAAGFIAVPNTSSATDISFAALCGGASVVSNAAYVCNPQNVTLTAACSIVLPAGVKLNLAFCNVDGGGHPVSIKGTFTSKLVFSNSSISNAAKIELNFGIGAGTGCGDAILANWNFDADVVDIRANGGITVDLRGVDPSPKGGISASNSILIKSLLGNVCVLTGTAATSDGLQADSVEIRSAYGSTTIGAP